MGSCPCHLQDPEVFLSSTAAPGLKWVCSRVQVDLEHGKSIPDWLQPTDMNSLGPSASPPGNGGTFWRALKQALNSGRSKEMLWLISCPARWKNEHLRTSCAFLLFPFTLLHLTATALVSRQGSGTENHSLCSSDGWGLLPLHSAFMVCRWMLPAFFCWNEKQISVVK